METEKELKMKTKAVYDLSNMINTKRLMIDRLDEEMGILKEEVRGLLKELNVKYMKNEIYEIKISYPEPVDKLLLIADYPDIAKRVIETSTETKEVNKLSKKNKELLKTEYPDVFQNVVGIATPRLTIKRL